MATDATPATGWYVTRDNGETEGPLSDAQMRQAIGRGRVKPGDHVWRDGMDEWVEARRIPNYSDVRTSYKQESERAARQELDKAVRKQPQRSTSRARPAPPIPRSSSSWSHDDQASPPVPEPRPTAGRWRRKTPSTTTETTTPAGFPSKDVMGGRDKNTIDLEKIFGQGASKIGKIPQGTIIFFALGFFFPPLLPIFWFIAYRIWAKANKK